MSHEAPSIVLVRENTLYVDAIPCDMIFRSVAFTTIDMPSKPCSLISPRNLYNL